MAVARMGKRSGSVVTKVMRQTEDIIRLMEKCRTWLAVDQMIKDVEGSRGRRQAQRKVSIGRQVWKANRCIHPDRYCNLILQRVGDGKLFLLLLNLPGDPWTCTAVATETPWAVLQVPKTQGAVRTACLHGNKGGLAEN